MEYCVGGDLGSLIKSDLTLPENLIQGFGRDIVRGLHYLHSQSVLHCNLRPSNILLDEKGVNKLGGFGMSRSLNDRTASVEDIAMVMVSALVSVLSTPSHF